MTENKQRFRDRLAEKLSEEWHKTNKLFLGGVFNFAFGAGLGAIGKSTG